MLTVMVTYSCTYSIVGEEGIGGDANTTKIDMRGDGADSVSI